MAAVKGIGKGKKIISIAIDEGYTKICDITKTNKDITVHRAVTIQNPEGSVTDGDIENMEGLAEAIKEVIANNQITSELVNFSLTSSRVATKEVVIPNVKASKVAAIIEANATEYFPVNIEEYIIQHVVLEKIAVDGVQQLRVLVMAAPADIVERYYKLAELLNLKVNSIDYAGNSSRQILQQQVDKNMSVVIHVENDSTVVSIFDNGILQLQRIIPYGKSVLVEETANFYEMSREAALSKLQKEILLHSKFDGDQITSSLMYLTRNISRVIDYYTSRNATKSMSRSFVVGNAITIRGFVKLLSEELKLTLEPLSTLYGVNCDKKTYVSETTIPDYVYCIGAAVNPVNFVPKVLIDNEKRKDSSKTFRLLLIASIGVSAIILAVPFSLMMSSKMQLDTLREDVKKLEPIRLIVEDYEVAKGMAEDAGAFAALTVNADDTLGQMIVQLEKNVPSDIVFANMSVQSGLVNMAGTAGSKSSVAKLIQQLQAIPGVTGVWVDGVSENQDNVGVMSVSFSVTFAFADVAAE